MSNALERHAGVNTRALASGNSYREPTAITQRLEEAAQKFHLVSPVTECPQLPEGCAVAFSQVMINPNTPGEVYSTGDGKLALHKSSLQRIAAAAGISWDPRLSRRLDNGEDPSYCLFQAVGQYRDFDGTLKTLSATKEMDLREGSETIKAVRAKAKAKNKNPDVQISEMRMHILSHAETKAQLRAIRSMGIKSSYTAEELRKPFLTAKLMFTGQSDDPELKRAFALKQADAMLGAGNRLYGELPPAPEPLQLAAPPPIDSVRPDPDEEDDVFASEFDSITETAPLTVESAPVAEVIPPSTATRKIPFGAKKGTSIKDATTKELNWLMDYYKKAIDNPEKAAYKASNNAEMNAIADEIAYRDGGQC